MTVPLVAVGPSMHRSLMADTNSRNAGSCTKGFSSPLLSEGPRPSRRPSRTRHRWPVVRPSGLFEASEVSPYEIALDHIGHRFTSRIDLADCLLRQVTGDEYEHAAIAVATTTIKPNMLKLIWREGIRKNK